MSALFFIWRRRIINSIRTLVRKPAKLVLSIFVVLMLLVGGVFSFIAVTRDVASAAPVTIGGSGGGSLTLVRLLILFLLSLVAASAMWTGTKHGGVMFTAPDAQFLFPSPLAPQTILAYGLVATLAQLVMSTFFMAYQIPNLYRAGLRGSQIGGIFIIWFVGAAASHVMGMLVYLVIQLRPQLRRVAQALIIALPLATVAVILQSLPQALLAGRFSSPMELISIAERSLDAPLLRLIPIIGWLHALVGAAMHGFKPLDWLALVLLVASVFLALIAIWRIPTDYYEDALAQADQLAARQEMAKEGRIVARKYRVRRTGLGAGEGASTFFYKHLLEFRRTRPYLVGIMHAVYLAVLIFVAIQLRDPEATSSGVVRVLILSAVAWFILFWHGMAMPLAYELDAIVYHLAPLAPLQKIWQATRFGLLRIAFDLLPAWLAVSIVLRLNPLIAVVGFIAAWSSCLAINGSQMVSLRLLGSSKTGFAAMLYMMIESIALGPGVICLALAIVQALQGREAAALLLACLIPIAHAAVYGIGLLFGVQVLERGMES